MIINYYSINKKLLPLTKPRGLKKMREIVAIGDI